MNGFLSIYNVANDEIPPNELGKVVRAHPDRSNEVSKAKWPNDSGRDPTLTSFI